MPEGRNSQGGGGNRMVPSPTQLRRYVAQGLTDQQIADAWFEKTGVRCSRSAITNARRRWGIESPRKRPRYEQEVPWRVSADDANRYQARMLRVWGQLNAGHKVKPLELKRFESFKRELDELNASIHYDPDHSEVFPMTPRREGETLVRMPDPR